MSAYKTLEGDKKLSGNFLKDLLASGTSVFSGLTAGATEASGALSVLWSVISANPLGAALTAIAAISALVTIVSNNIETAAEANQHMEESWDAYESAKSEVESVDSELETTQEKIDNLLAKDSLTFVEQGQLDDLRESVDLLKTQQEIAEHEEERAAKEAAESAVNAFEKNFKDPINEEETKFWEDNLATGAVPQSAIDAGVSGKIAALREYKSELKDLQKQYDEAVKAGDDDTASWLSDEIADVTEMISGSGGLEESIQTSLDDLLNYQTKLEGVPEELRTAKQTETLQQVKDYIDYIYSEIDPDQLKQNKFDEIFDTTALAKAKNELLELAKASDNVGISAADVTANYPELAAAVEKAGFTIEDLVNNINSEAGIMNFDTVRDQIKSKFSESLQNGLENGADNVDTSSTEKSVADKTDNISDSIQKNIEDSTANIDTGSASNQIRDKYQDLYQNLKDEQQKIEDWGLSEYGNAFDTSGNSFIQSQFGNVDMDSRKIIKWSKKIKSDYSDALASWEYDPDLGSIDTVFGASNRFGEDVLENGVEVAFTPIMEVDGKAKLLDKKTVYDYINELVDESTTDGVFSEEKLLSLDKQGKQISDTFVQGIIAAADEGLDYDNNGNWADVVGRLMHFSGEYGSIALAYKDIEDAANEAGMSVDDFLSTLSNDSDKTENKVSDTVHSAAGVTVDAINEMKQKVSNAMSDQSDDFNEWINGLDNDELQLAYQIDFDTNGNEEIWQAQLDALKTAADDTATSVSDSLNAVLTQFETMRSALSEQSSDGYLSADTISKLKEANEDYSSALVNTASGMVLDTQKTNELTKQQGELAIATADAEKAAAKLTYDNNVKEMEKLAGGAENLKKILEEQPEVMPGVDLDKLYSLDRENTGLENQISEWQALQSEIRGAISLLKQYEDAQSTPNASDPYQEIVSGKEKADELYNQGWIDKDDFTSYAMLISGFNESIDEAVANYEQNSKKMERYLTEDGNGLYNFLDDAVAKSKELGKSFVTLGENGYELNIDDMNEFAEAMDVNTELAEHFVLALKDLGFDIDLSVIGDSIQSDISAIDTSADDAVSKVSSIISRMQELAAAGGDVTESVSSISGVLQELSSAGVDVSSLVTQLNQLGQVAGFQIDPITLEVTYQANTAETDSATQEVTQPENKEITYTSNTADTDSATAEATKTEEKTVEGKIDYTVGETPDDDEAPTLNGKIDYTVGEVPTDADAPTLNGKINYTGTSTTATQQSPTASGTANYGLGESPSNVPDATGTANFNLGESPEEVPDAKGTANFGLGDSPSYVPDASGTANFELGSYPTSIPSITQTVYQQVVGSKGISVATGTAFAGGTVSEASPGMQMWNNHRASIGAYAYGNDWALHYNQNALVNEIGQESIVRDGHWFPIPGGAHVEQLKRGDIIFNAAQTKELMETGRVLSGGGHGKVAMANGTAYNMLNAYYNSSVTGSGPKRPTRLGSGSSGSSSGSSSSGGSSSSSSGNNNKSKSKSSSDDVEKVDYIEIALDRIERKISKLKTAAENVFKSFKSRAKSLTKEISQTTKEIDLQEKAYKRYIKEANSVSLSSSIKKQIRDGSINITEYSKDTQELISEYKEWYEKALNCKDAIDELNSSLNDLKEQKIDLIIEKWDKKLQGLEHKIDRLDAKIDRQTEKADSGNYSYYYTRAVYKANAKNASTNLSRTKSLLEYRKDELAEVNKELNAMLKKDPSIKNTQGYKDLLKKKYDLEDSADELRKNIVDYTNDIFDAYKSLMDTIADEYDDKVQDLQHKAERTEATISRRNAYASDHVNMSESRDAAGKNITNYQSLIKNNQSQIKIRKSEFNKLTSQLEKELKEHPEFYGTKEFYEMTEQIQDVENEIDQLNAGIIDFSNSISEEYKRVFDNLEQEFSNMVNLIQHEANEINSALDLSSTKGRLSAKGYYNSLKSINDTEISTLTAEKEALQKQLYKALASGEIEAGSSDYYAMKQSINGVAESLINAQNEVEELDIKIRQCDWDNFDYLQDRISRINDEAEFLIELMSNDKLVNDNGSFTDEGNATMGLYAVEYNTYMAQADKYAEELKKIQAEIAADPADSNLIARKEELIDAQQEAILNAEKEKQAIKDLVEDGIDAELDSLQELIDKYTDLLDRQKDLYDYSKNVKKQAKEIATLQKQLSAYSGDLSEETQAKVQQIKVDLEEAQDDLQETEYDHMISEQKAMLDNLYDEYERILNERLDDVDALIEDVIDQVNSSSSDINSTLTKVSSDVGYTMTTEMKNIWASERGVVTSYGDQFSSTLTSVNTTVETISSKMAAMVTAAEAEAKAAQDALAFEKEQAAKAEAEALEQAKQNKNNTKDDANNSVEDTAKTVIGQSTENAASSISIGTLINTKTPAKTGASSSNRDSNGNLINGLLNDGNGGTYYIDKNGKTVVVKTGNTSTSKSTQGDGKIQVGDKVTFKSGRYYNNSSGGGPSGNSYLGKKVYITSINSKGSKPYHISTGKKLGSGDLGWVTKAQLSGYAAGLLKAKKDEAAWINENGTEAVISPSDNAIVTHISKGDSVLDAKATKNIWDIGTNPENFVKEVLRKDGVLSDGLAKLFESGIASNLLDNLPDINTPVAANGTTVGDITYQINIPIDHVENYDDFMNKMKADGKFEKMVQSMTIDQLVGGSKIAKRKYQW